MEVSAARQRAWVLVCANGFVHVEAGGMPTAETERCAIDAASFMDECSDDSPWDCGPHTVREGSI